MEFKKWFNEDEHDFFNFPEEAMKEAWDSALAQAPVVPEGQFMLPREFLVEYLELLRDSDKSAIYKLVITDQVGAILKESK